jgi:ATP-binding cassette, subfamily B, bacterial
LPVATLIQKLVAVLVQVIEFISVYMLFSKLYLFQKYISNYNQTPDKYMKFLPQYDSMDCGAACLQMISRHYGKNHSLEYLRNVCYLNKQGSSLMDLNDGAEKLGFRSIMAKVSLEQIIYECPSPSILHWNDNHYVVLFKISKKNKIKPLSENNILFWIADPGHGIVKIDLRTVIPSFIKANNKGVALLLEPTPAFYNYKNNGDKKPGLIFLFNYLKPYKRYLTQMLLSVVVGCTISLIFPFLTQILVDYGINYKNLKLIYILLFSQLMLFFGELSIDLIRNWILLHINTRVSIAIISDFLLKLMRLPIKFFDIRAYGDIVQRINDHHRIENFLTNITLDSVFSFLNILVFIIILIFYNVKIAILFFLLSSFSILWIVIFLRKRKQLDYKKFLRLRNIQEDIHELISGMQEIKLNNCETIKRWGWERNQAALFTVNIKSLVIDQYQKTGFLFINQFKNILISFFAAQQVIQNTMTIGMLLGVSFIIGQTNGPLEQLINFFRSAQDAKISVDRLKEIHNKTDEEHPYKNSPFANTIFNTRADVIFNDVSFQYGGPHSDFVLKNIKLTLPNGKVTAIVGTSGSGKTTLLKLFLKFYDPVCGNIKLGNHDFSEISPKWLRNQCGVVMQDGHIFGSTIAQNIAFEEDRIDSNKLIEVTKSVNIYDFIQCLPYGFSTIIGSTGINLSAGQLQRILIARALYKEPSFLLFDEATSALDAQNEKIIVENLKTFFYGKTVLVIAHRLSTVKNANQIIVLDKGEIVETGNHEFLIKQKAYYYNLIKNQLELGN